MKCIYSHNRVVLHVKALLKLHSDRIRSEMHSVRVSYPSHCDDALDVFCDDESRFGTSDSHVQQVPLIVRNFSCVSGGETTTVKQHSRFQVEIILLTRRASCLS